MSTHGKQEPMDVVASEVARVLAEVDPAGFDRFVAQLRVPQRAWFCTGQGRSGLVAQMAAMRLMHLSHQAHVVGETTAPAITSNDTLLIVSASGTTPGSLHFAETARAVSATVVLVTAASSSPLRQLADTTLEVPALTSTQFGGSLFEQTALLVLDAAALTLGPADSPIRDAMHRRHANLQ